jgi:hypothetical protein
MGRMFFIAGCARSGTTLLLQLMPSFKDMNALTCAERHFSYFSQMDVTHGNVLLKRTFDSYLSLPDMAPDINLIYTVRHPFDTFTSYHPKFPHRRFYVSERRWRGEYAALKELRVKQPARTITYVRYCDLVTSPDAVQRYLATNLDLQIHYSFSESGIRFSTSSIKKYENDRELERYLWLLPHGLRQTIKEFCDEFGYELPPGYVRSPSLIGDSIRRIIVPIRARKWPMVLRVAPTLMARTLKHPHQARQSLSRLLRRPNRVKTAAHRPEK